MKHLPYDVFINHHGGDAKHGIASNIYNKLDATGLRVFLDKDELKSGDFFPKILEAAMRSSSVHIAIFSENYAQSPWCLDELDFILQLPNIKFIPIFYHVKPSTLRWAIKEYGKAFEDHEINGRYAPKKLENWKLALHTASHRIGEIISNQGEEAAAVNKVVNLVLEELKKVRIYVDKHPVGLDEAEQDFNNTLLNSAAGEVQMVGILGMGGAGKTTLAKHLLNKKFKNFAMSCFVSDVREAAREKVLYKKQKELLKDLGLETSDFNNVDKGKEILRSCLRSVHVLIVLDDVDHTDQLDALLPERDSLGKGSLIIVTTRELRVLKASGISAIYKIRTLNASHATELFSWHAFGQLFPLSGFEDLAQKFIDACQRLPLSLKVFGALLRGEPDKKYWQSTLVEVSRTVPDDIKSTLRISYDALGKKEKQMFLDVACFFIGESRSRAIAVWNVSDWNGLYGWHMLVNKCLVEDVFGRIRMHDHLRDLGREIANQQSPYRLWSKTQIIEIQPQQLAVQVRGMANAFGANCSSRQGQITLNTNEGERTLQRGALGLKIFIGSGDFPDEQYSELSKDLVYLQWTGFPHRNLPSWLPLKKLRILELLYSERLQGLWERAEDAPSALKERMDKIESFKSLTSLEELRIYYCPQLDGLAGLGELICLKKIKLERCYKLQKIEGLRSLTSLEGLSIWACPLDGLAGLGELISLKKIELIGCDKLQKIEGLGSLKSLETLKINNCRELNTLPSLVELTFLKEIQLKECHKLEKIGGLRSLTSLEELRIYNCPQLDGLAILGELISLKKIDLIGCHKLQKIEGLESLKSLETLEINECRELNTLPSLAELTFLKEIDLFKCHKLEKIGGLRSVTSLEGLSIFECPQLDRLEVLGELISLKKLAVKWCDKLQKIEGLRSLTSLEELSISGCLQLDGLPGLGELISLKKIELQCCYELQKIEDLESLKSLETLTINGPRELNTLPSLAGLTFLKRIDLEECQKLENIGGLRNLTSLEVLRIYECPQLDGLAALGELISLKQIDLIECHKLQKIEGLRSLTSLEELNIWRCPQLDGLAGLGELISLKRIELKGCHKLQKIEGLESLKSLETLQIINCRELNTLPSLAELTFLKDIELKECPKLEKIEGLRSLTSLEGLRIRIDKCPQLDGLAGLGE